MLRWVLVVLLLPTLALISEAQNPKVEAGKLVGTWTFVKSDSKNQLPRDANFKVEFTKDGKLIAEFSVKDKTFKLNGTYSLKGDQLTTTIMNVNAKGDKTDIVTLVELTDKKMVFTEKKDGNIETTEFKR